MDVIQGQTALCHPVSGHRAVDAAGEHIQGTTGGTHGQAALSGYFRAMNIRAVIANLHNDLELGVLHIHPQVVVQPQQVSAQLPHQFRAGHGVGLIRTAGLHLEGLDAVQAVAQILLRSPADGIKVLFADHGTAQRRQTKHGAHPVKGQVHVHVLFFGLHIKGRLGAVHLELAHGLEPVAQDLHHGRLKLVAVQALQGHLALIAHNNFTHRVLLNYSWLTLSVSADALPPPPKWEALAFHAKFPVLSRAPPLGELDAERPERVRMLSFFTF